MFHRPNLTRSTVSPTLQWVIKLSIHYRLLTYHHDCLVVLIIHTTDNKKAVLLGADQVLNEHDEHHVGVRSVSSVLHQHGPRRGEVCHGDQ